MVLEIKDIEKPLMEYAEKLGFKQEKVVYPGRKGCADRLLKHVNCPPFFMELKTNEGKISRPQIKRAKEWDKVGFPTFFVDSVTLGTKVIRLGSQGKLPKPGEVGCGF